MFKIEYVWRELLFQAIDSQNTGFSITDLSQKFKLSTSVVSHALEPLRNLNMVEVGKRESRVVDAEKLLLFWATKRNFYKDVTYETTSDLPIAEIEVLMPEDVVATGYTSFTQFFKNTPADYDKVYYYAYDLEEVKKRYPFKKTNNPNLIILSPDPYLKTYEKLPTAQLFADLWNIREWQAHDFANALLLKIKSNLGL